MELHEAKTVIEADCVKDVNTLLEKGWTLVAVVSGNRPVNDVPGIGPIYVLAKGNA